MINPFKYGGIVGKDSFCNRKKELEDIVQAMKNGERLFVYSERRMGKTSLLHLALSKLPKRHYIRVYVDLWPTDGVESFTSTIAAKMTESMATTADKMLVAAKSFFGRLTPSVTIDSSGNPQVTFGLEHTGEIQPKLVEVLSAPAKIAAKRNNKVVVVFDEFQRLLEYDNDLTERTLRSVIQNQPNVSYVFSGSRKHLIQKMFLDQSRPLYRSGGHYPIGSIDAKNWLPFIRKRFLRFDKRISDDLISVICRKTGGHPFYTQHLCHAVWELCETNVQATDETVDAAVRLLLNRASYAYSAQWESLTQNHRRFLIGLAQQPPNVKVFSSDFLRRYNLRSASNVQRAVNALLNRDIIDRDNGSFIISDRFFRIWINRL